VRISIVTQTNADNWTVRVTNPDGKVSNTAGFQVVVRQLRAYHQQRFAEPGNRSTSSQTVTINGTGFVNAPTVFVT